MEQPAPVLFKELVSQALKEDLGHGDVTTMALIPPDQEGKAIIRAKAPLVVCGLGVAREVFWQVDSSLEVSGPVREGEEVVEGEGILEIQGKIASILMAERVALNFLQHLSGVATLTRRFVEKVKGLPVRIVDTRKTLPGFRILEKHAVRVGGGHNHRFGLSDGVLIKDNHIKACGSVKKALEQACKRLPHVYLIEIEVKSLRELEEAIEAQAPAILLDNMDLDTLRKAVSLVRKRAPGTILEASGGVDLENVRAIAETGVDIISIGALTHSAPAVDLSLKIV
ncbi:carboxylating nicotinate-nucleotide diphosphorylase [Thermosulfuriphilus sp.]